MAFDVGAIVGKLQLNKDQWNQSIKQVKAEQRRLSVLVTSNSQQFKQMGRAMTVAGTAIVGSIGLMVKAHATFDHAMNESLAIMGDISEATRREMAQTALDMSTKSTFAAKELAKAYFFLASAGMDAKQSIKALPVVAKFAQAGAFDLATATDLLTDAQTALGLSSKNAVKNQENLIKVSDVLVKANTLANASVQQFSEALTNRAAAALVNVNKSLEEGVAVLAAYADKGVKGQIAGTRLAMMLNALDIAARRNKRAWDENGIALFDAQGEMRSMGNIIGDLEGLLSSMSTEQRSATLAALGFNVRTKASILTLMGSSEKIKQWEKDLSDAGGTTEQVAKKQLESLINQFTVLKNKITEAAISVGKTLGPALKDMIEDVKGVVAKVAEWIKTHPKLTELIAKGAVAVGGLLMVLGPLMMMLPGLVIILPQLAAGFTLLLGPVGAVAIAATAVGIALNKLIDNYKSKQDAEMDAMVDAGKGHAKFWAFRSKLIAEEIVTVEEWAEIYKKHGKNYKRVMKAISTLPEYQYLRDAWTEMGKSIEEESKKMIESIEKVDDSIDYMAIIAKVKLLELQMELDSWKLPEIVKSPEELLSQTGLTGFDETFRSEWDRTMHDSEERSEEWLNNQLATMGIFTTKTKKLAGDREVAEISTIDKIAAASMMALGQSKLGTIARATMSAYAGAAMSLETFGMPWAIPFIAMSLASGFKQVADIEKVAIPSAEKGAYIPHPALVEAGHGRLGEVVLPLDEAPLDLVKETGDTSPTITQLRLIIQNKITIGEQTFYKESVKSINKAGELRDLVVPNEVVI